MNKITQYTQQYLKNNRVLFLLIFAFMFNVKLAAQDYPFNLPSTITASLNVETSNTEIFNNKLLGYNIEGFNTRTEKDFLELVNPVTIRFPHGVWANFYEWQDDTYQQDDYDNGTHQNVLNTYVSSIKGHIAGIASLNRDKIARDGFGYDMMWTYSINFDDGASSVARAKKDIELGLEVKAIELGNEHFWKNQRSNRTALPSDYLREASAVSTALKTDFPDIQLSIPLGWRRSQGGYNSQIIGNGNYFDAITVHKYLGADPDEPGQSNTAYSSLLTAKLELEEDVNWVRDNYAPGKPVWLTEWGVSAGSDVHGAACLGMADAYLFMAENQQIYDRANWFSFNRVLNAMVVVGSNRQPVYPLQKRGYLSTFEILQDVLRDATMLKGTLTSSAQLSTSRGAVNAVNARATTKDGQTNVIAINLTDKPIEFELKFDNVMYAGNFKHESLIFDNVGVVNAIDYNENQLSLVKEGSGKIILPPLSVSKISNIVIDDSIKLIAGTIEAEDYKDGGQGVGYSDTTTDNTLSSGIDTDGVDVGVSSDITYVGDTENGEWLKYNVNVLQDGIYDFEFVYATLSSGALIGIEIDDVSLFDSFALNPTASETNFQKSTKESVTLVEGIHELKVNIQNGGFSLDKINVNFIPPPPTPVFVTLQDGFVLEPGSDLEVEASTTLSPSKINKMNLFLDNVLVRSITSAPFKWGFDGQSDTVLENMTEGTYDLKLVLTDNGTQFSETTISVNVRDFPLQPYGGAFHQVPGVIQVEDYDLGGEGFAFSDSTLGNSGDAYRTEAGEDVDISVGGSGFISSGLSGGEYTRYSINVKEAGSYKMLVNYRTYSATSKPFSAKLLSSDLSESRDLFVAPSGSTDDGIVVIDGGVFGDYTSNEFDLQAGNAVLELHIPSGGAGPNYDYITLERVGVLSTIDVNSVQEKLKVFPVPSNDGKFFLSKSHEWKVYSVLGSLVKEGKGKEINLSSVVKGIYLLRTSSGETKRLISN